MLTLVGYLKTDYKGPERLRKVFDELRPDVMLLDCDQKAYNRGLKNHQHLNRWTLYDDVRGKVFNAVDYDKWVSEEYMMQTVASLAFIGEKRPGLRYPEKTLDKLLKEGLEDVQQDIDDSYDIHQISMLSDDRIDDIKQEMNIADNLMSIRAGYTAQNNPESRLVVLAKVMDIYGDQGSNLYQCMKDLQPSRMLLKEADEM